ncbi:hypothetical protein Tco_1275703 [Tanacetum coccineum]
MSIPKFAKTHNLIAFLEKPEEILALETTKSNQALEIKSLKRRVKSLEKRRKSRTLGFKRLRKGRKNADLDADAEVTLVDKTQEMNNDNLMFDTCVLEEHEKEVAEKEVSVADPVTTAGEVVTIDNVEVTTANAPTTTIDELTLAQTLIEIKAAKSKAVKSAATTTTTTRPKARGVVVQELSEFKTTSSPLQASQLPQGLIAQEKRSKPPTKAQKRNTMSTYLKNMARYKHNQLKSKSYDEIQEMSSKRAGDELESYNSKKQKIDVHVKAKKDDDQEDVEMKKHIEIVKDDEVAIDAIHLATKPLMIVKYKIVKEGKFLYFQLIRADGSSKRYLSMIKMLQNINREDLETLWKLVKAKHRNTRPEDEYERVLWGDMKVMFKPDIKSEVWRNLQGYKVTI